MSASATKSDFNPEAALLFNVGCYLAIVISLVGVAMNHAVAASLWSRSRRWDPSSSGTSDPGSLSSGTVLAGSSLLSQPVSIDSAVFLMCASCLLFGLLVALDNVIFLAGGSFAALRSAGGTVISILFYGLVLMLFTANMVLALERFWLLKYGTTLTRRMLVYLLAVVMLFWVLTAASFLAVRPSHPMFHKLTPTQK
ncbi:hypothetical protein BC830DRAFT_770649 [Chytriomyces sp. MP71]|nr:hypothetical protein BC830DRAFT_770649 [Chytriomyces sp. MP71]